MLDLVTLCFQKKKKFCFSFSGGVGNIRHCPSRELYLHHTKQPGRKWKNSVLLPDGSRCMAETARWLNGFFTFHLGAWHGGDAAKVLSQKKMPAKEMRYCYFPGTSFPLGALCDLGLNYPFGSGSLYGSKDCQPLEIKREADMPI